jgi:hypothetical protein
MKCGIAGIALFSAIAALLNFLTMSQGNSAPVNPSAYCGEAETVDTDDIEHMESQEARCLRQLSQWASRKGIALALRLDSGTIKTYKSNPKACEEEDGGICIRYYLIGYHARSRLFFVWVDFYEAHGLILVSARNGTETDLLNIPHFAPDGLTFVVVDSQPTHETKYDFAIGSVATNPPSLTWTRKTHDDRREWESRHWLDWEFGRWLDKDRVAVTTSSARGAVLTRNGKVWKLDLKFVPEPAAPAGGESIWSRVPTR